MNFKLFTRKPINKFLQKRNLNSKFKRTKNINNKSADKYKL